MKALAIEHEIAGTTSADFAPYLDEEAAHIWDLYKQGILREFYFHATDHVAVLMLECDSTDDAKRILGYFPLVKAGLIKFQVIPLAPYDGFSRLFPGHAT